MTRQNETLLMWCHEMWRLQMAGLGLQSSTHMLPLLSDHRSVSKEVLQREAFYVRPGRGAVPGDLQPPGVEADWLGGHSLRWIWFHCKYDKDGGESQYEEIGTLVANRQSCSWRNNLMRSLKQWSPTFCRPRTRPRTGFCQTMFSPLGRRSNLIYKSNSIIHRSNHDSCIFC